jgi:hypothetical protein
VIDSNPQLIAWLRHGHEDKADWVRWLDGIRDDAIAEFLEDEAAAVSVGLQMEILTTRANISDLQQKLPMWVMDDQIGELDGYVSVCFATRCEPSEEAFHRVHGLTLEIEGMETASPEHWLYFFEDESN